MFSHRLPVFPLLTPHVLVVFPWVLIVSAPRVPTHSRRRRRNCDIWRDKSNEQAGQLNSQRRERGGPMGVARARSEECSVLDTIREIISVRITRMADNAAFVCLFLTMPHCMHYRFTSTTSRCATPGSSSSLFFCGT